MERERDDTTIRENGEGRDGKTMRENGEREREKKERKLY